MKHKFVKVLLTAFVINFIHKGISLQLIGEILNYNVETNSPHLLYAGCSPQVDFICEI